MPEPYQVPPGVPGSFYGRFFLLRVPAGGLHGPDVLYNDGTSIDLLRGEAFPRDLSSRNLTVVDMPAQGAVDTVPAIDGGIHADVKVLGAFRAPEFEFLSRHRVGGCYLDMLFRCNF